jgi:hypothetical protein
LYSLSWIRQRSSRSLQIPNLPVGSEAVTMVTHVSEKHTDPIFSVEYKKHKQQAQSPKWEVVRSSKSRQTSIGLHGVTSQRSVILATFVN